MKLRLLVGLPGPTTLNAGDAYEADDSEAVRMICSRLAVPWTEPEIERAVARPVVETRAPKGKRKK